MAEDSSACLLLSTQRQDDREDLLRQVAVVAGVAGQEHENPLGHLHPVHLPSPTASTAVGERRGGGLDTASGDFGAAAVARAWRTVRSATWASLLGTAWTAPSQPSPDSSLLPAGTCVSSATSAWAPSTA